MLKGRNEHHERIAFLVVILMAVGVLGHQNRIIRSYLGWSIDNLFEILSGIQRGYSRAVNENVRVVCGREKPECVAEGPGGERYGGEVSAPRIGRRQLFHDVIAERIRRGNIGALVSS